MTVSSTTVKNSYSGNGSNDTFVYGFKIFADTDLEVIIRSATGTETIKTLTTHYTVTGAGSASGGNVVFTSGNIPTGTETVVVRREVPQTQAIDYIANDPFPAESHEEGLDRATMTIQQLQEEVNRSIKLSATNTMTSTEFTVGATDRANKVLSFDSAGELAVTQELGTFKGNSATTTTAAYAVRDIVKATTTAQLNNIYICIKTSPIGTALTNTTFWVLLVDAVSAATSATAAAASATTSGNSATASANSATTSANSATTSGNSATASGNSATASANSATAAAASADAFDDIYLGTKSSDPSTDNDGDALAAGMLYFNSTNNILRVYSGSAWQDAALSSTGVVTLTGTQTLTNKTLTTPKIAEIDSLGSGDITLDAEVDINLDAATDVNIPANVGLTFGNDGEKIEGDGTNLTINSSADVIMKLGGDQLILHDGSSNIGQLDLTSNHLSVEVLGNDKDMFFKGFDGGGSITALTLDMSAAGAATFNDAVILGTNKEIQLVDTNESIKSDGSKMIIKSGGTSFNLPTADGSANQVLKTDGSGTLSFAAAGGITMADQWRVTTSFTGSAAPISSNWERNDTAPSLSYFGSQMTESSGVFTFPSTGIYYVSFTANVKLDGDSRFNYGLIKGTTDGSTLITLTEASTSITQSQSAATLASVSSDIIIDVTNTSNHKVAFEINVSSSSTEVTCSGVRDITFVRFIRLGDT